MGFNSDFFYLDHTGQSNTQHIHTKAAEAIDTNTLQPITIASNYLTSIA